MTAITMIATHANASQNVPSEIAMTLPYARTVPADQVRVSRIHSATVSVILARAAAGAKS